MTVQRSKTFAGRPEEGNLPARCARPALSWPTCLIPDENITLFFLLGDGVYVYHMRISSASTRKQEKWNVSLASVNFPLPLAQNNPSAELVYVGMVHSAVLHLQMGSRRKFPPGSRSMVVSKNIILIM